MNPFVFACPLCQKFFQVRQSDLGMILQCPHCQKKIRLPHEISQTTPDQPQAVPPNQSEKQADAAQPSQPNPAAEVTPTKKPTQKSRSTQKSKPPQQTNPPPKVAGVANAPLNEVDEKTSIRPTPARSDKIPSSNRPHENLIPPKFVADEVPQAPNPQATEKSPATELVGEISDDSSRDSATESSEKSLVDSTAQLPFTNQTAAAPPNPGTSALTNLPLTSSADSPLGLDDDRPTRDSVQPSESSSIASTASASGSDSTTRENLLPPKFDVFDPNKIRNRFKTSHKVLLPTAEGGVQTIDDRTVTVEYKGEKYILIAMSPEQKLRRQRIANVIAIVIAALAIYATFKILTW